MRPPTEATLTIIPLFLLAKIRQNFTADVHHAENIRLKLLLDLLLRGGFKRADQTVTRVIDNRVDAPEFFNRRGNRLLLSNPHPLRPDGNIRCRRFAANLPLFRASASSRRPSSFWSEKLGGFLSDAARRAGD